MLYETYQRKIDRVADILAKLVRLIPLFIAVFAVILATVIGLLAVKGTVSEFSCNVQVNYGSSLNCSANSFLSDVRYQYRDVSDEEWLEGLPNFPGTYAVRAVGTTVFGKDRYSNEKTVVIAPKQITVYPESKMEYGDTPKAISSGLVGSDRILCDDFIILPYKDGDYSNENSIAVMKVTPVQDEIIIQDENGNDITSAYVIQIATQEVSVTKREISLQITDASKIYDGKLFYSSEYEYIKGSLLDGDRLQLSFGDVLTDIGETENLPTWKILNKSDEDVSMFYQVSLKSGKLTVEKRPVSITTGSLENILYNGKTVECTDFTMNSAWGLVTGHQLVLLSHATPVDAGVYLNTMEFAILDANGKDVTENYDLTVTEGTITILPLPIQVTTEDILYAYDGLPKTPSTYTLSGTLAEGHTHSVGETFSFKTVGVYENKLLVVIKDAEDKDVTQNYEITYVYGTLTIKKLRITVMTPSEQWVYDGTQHSNTEITVRGEDGWSITDEYAISVVNATTIQYVGTAENVIAVKIIRVDSQTDVTENFEIEYQYGTLTVTKRPLTITTGSNAWIYDGKEHFEKNPVFMNGTSLASGDRITATKYASLKNVGKVSNIWEGIDILDARSIRVLDQYDLKVNFGTLEVQSCTIEIKPADVEKIYDGLPLFPSDWEYREGSVHRLGEGHSLVVEFAGSQTDAGSAVSRIVSARVLDENQEDVTKNYTIKTFEGTLLVKPRPIEIKPVDESKIYDGFPLFAQAWEYTEASEYMLVNGHILTATYQGEQTLPGRSNSYIQEVHIMDGSRDVTRNYEIHLMEGTLTVTETGDPNDPNNPENPENPDNPNPPEIPDNPNAPEAPDDSETFGSIKTNVAQIVYLRRGAYGYSDGKTNTAAPVFAKKLPGGYTYDYLTSMAMKAAGFEAYTAEFKDMLFYLLPYYRGEGSYPSLESDASHGFVTDDSYSLQYYYANISDYTKLQGKLPGAYLEWEKEYRNFVYDSYLYVETETKNYMNRIIAEQNFSLSDPNVIMKIATYIQNAAEYNLLYDPAMEEASNIVIAFLETYKEGVCRHYAASATLLYRALGIPARYVEGFMLETTANEFVDIKNPGHAWVEVYMDGVGWMQVEVTGGSGGGDSGSGSGSGSGGAGSDEGSGGGGDSDNNPDAIPLPVYLYQLQKYYDGTPIAFEEFDFEFDVPEGVSVEISLNISLTEVGRLTLEALNMNVSKYATLRVYKTDTHEDVTDDYRIVFEPIEDTDSYVPIMVEPQQITVTAASETKLYDGTPLTNGNAYVSFGSLAEGHYMRCKTEGSIINPGSETNKLTEVVIYDREGKDVTYNYDITMIHGDLTIIDPDI